MSRLRERIGALRLENMGLRCRLDAALHRIVELERALERCTCR